MTTTNRVAADPVGADLLRLLKALKLGALADTLPERAALARQHKLSHIGFLETLLADEVSRRESRSAALRAAKAGLDPTMRFDSWTAQQDLRYDRTLLGDLTSLRFLDAGQSAIILGPVGVGKTHLATALGHLAIRRRHTVLFARSDKLFTRLRAARLDHTVDAEIRRLAAVDVLIIDDFALRPLDATETSDFYEIVVERHQTKTTIVTSNREPAKAHLFARTCAEVASKRDTFALIRVQRDGRAVGHRRGDRRGRSSLLRVSSRTLPRRVSGRSY
ncbi:ATP-binding protein [Mycolicibacterium sp. jd]|uniref:ATP-binding protein n=1 Tax=unclassified Mycolicibacterium TaxID=2636767 RepID=UPI00351AFE1A